MPSLLTAYGLANEIRMARRNGENRSILIIEGRSDHKFYSNYINHKLCVLYGREGKEVVRGCVEILNRDPNVVGYLGIVDLDYDKILGIVKSEANLVYVSDGDLERMLLQDSVLKKVNIEYCAEHLTIDREAEIIDKVLEESAKIGLYRLAAAICERKFPQNPHRMKFDGFDIGAMMPSSNSIDLDYGLIEAEIIRNTGRELNFDKIMTAAELDTYDDLPWDNMQLSQGHDIYEIICRGIERIWGFRFINPNALLSTARVAYTLDDFKKTNVYVEIKKWEAENTPYRILL